MKVRIMKDSTMLKVVLLVSGLTAICIAGTILLAPEAFYGTYGIELGRNVNLVNELKAPSGVLLTAGMLMLVGTFKSKFAFVSTVTAAAIYLPYGLSRLLSMAIDGLPNSALVTAALFELVIGAICLHALLRFQKTEEC